jgi:hypothetical protein
MSRMWIGSISMGALRGDNDGNTAQIASTMRGRSWQWAGLLLMTTTAFIVAAVFALNSTLAKAPAADPPARHAGTSMLAEHRVIGSPPVGALFYRENGRVGRHFCTASAVASTTGDLVITAAHCVTGVSLSPASGVVFAPDYANGKFPHGLWTVTKMFVDANWSANQDPNDDVAFLEVEPLNGPQVPASEAAPPTSLQRAAGAEQIRFNAPLPEPILAVGYNDGSSTPISCATRAVAFRPGSLNQVMFVCPGFSDGTSGGPFLSDFSVATGTGAIIGVIGGYQQGGDTPVISYSSAFAANIKALYQHVLKTG